MDATIVCSPGPGIRYRVLNQIQNRLPNRRAVEMMYFRKFRRLPNLLDPQTFTEKIAWRKLFQHDPRFTLFADKIAAKDEVSNLIGPQSIVKTLWTGKTPEEIPLDSLKTPYVIKVNHSSGNPIFVRNNPSMNKVPIVEAVRKQLAVEHGHLFREWGYCKINRAIIVEEMLFGDRNIIPDDFKFFVYHGKVRFIQVDTARFTSHRRSFFDNQWNQLPVAITYEPLLASEVDEPAALANMITIAEDIGKQFDFVRVDLYNLPERIVFGEATFYPGAGIEPFCPSRWDGVFGEPWNLQSTNIH